MKKINNLAHFVLGFTFVFAFFSLVNSTTTLSQIVLAEEQTSPVETVVPAQAKVEEVSVSETFVPDPTEEKKIEEVLPKVETAEAAPAVDTASALASAVLGEALQVVAPPLKAKVSATKIVCNEESDLPNWGADGSDITSTTATTFLAAHTNCHKEAWSFAWTESSITPVIGDQTTGTGGTGWTGFNDSTLTEVPSQTKIWVREQFKDGYIPFQGVTIAESVSAELYCNTDVYNYDNLEFIDTIAGQTYHCVAFNVLKTTPTPTPNACDASVNLIQNGNFEAPVLANATWDVIPASNPMLKWMVAWVSPEINGRLGLEIQNHVVGNPLLNEQHAELDGDHPVTIWQDVPTVSGQTYTLSFGYSPRQANIDNSIQVKINGVVQGATINANGDLNTNTVWQTVTRTFVATGATTKVEFYDNGPDNTQGGYLDNVTLKCAGTTPTPNPTSNVAPVANAGVDQTLTLPTTTATLNGTGSTDSDGTITSYVWSFVSGPSTINPDDVVSPNISSLVAGTYVFQLVVTDDDGATGTDTVSIVINPEGTNNTNGSGSNGGGGGIRAKCNDNKDNDADGLVDEEDPGCHSDGNANNPDSYDKRDRSEDDGGAVLGAATSTSCGIYVEKYLRKGYKNNVDSVVKVQVFLNDYMGAGLMVDGVYGTKTEEAVRAFQVKQMDNVLAPWGISEPTGIFYLTTQTEVNNIVCPPLDLPIPSNLVNFTPSVI
ncbi:MAG: PKD domain-containing protein [Patescibacteria group bacterium]